MHQSLCASQRTLEGGGAAKSLLDAVLDAAAQMQNLREAIAGYRGRLMQESVEDKRNALLQVCSLGHINSPLSDPHVSHGSITCVVVQRQ